MPCELNFEECQSIVEYLDSGREFIVLLGEMYSEDRDGEIRRIIPTELVWLESVLGSAGIQAARFIDGEPNLRYKYMLYFSKSGKDYCVDSVKMDRDTQDIIVDSQLELDGPSIIDFYTLFIDYKVVADGKLIDHRPCRFIREMHE